MPSPARLGSHFALSRHGFMTPMCQLSLARGLHFYEHAPSPCPRPDKPMAKRLLSFIQAPSKPWPPITRPTQPSLAYLFPPLPLTKHKYKTRTSSHTFLFAPLKLNFIASSQRTSTCCGGHSLQAKCATSISPPLKEIDVLINAYVSFYWNL